MSDRIKTIIHSIISNKVISLLFYSAAAFGQPIHFHAEKITVNDGLSQNTVQSILQDEHGYLWIATLSGLNRYDGSNVKVFNHTSNENDTAVSFSNFINSIRQTSSGEKYVLWLGTESGLDKLDYINDKYTHYTYLAGNNNSICSNNIISLYDDSNGYLWIGTENGVSRFDTRTESFTNYHEQSKEISGTNGPEILSFAESPAKSGIIWVGTANGLKTIDKQNNIIKEYFNPAVKANKFLNCAVNCLELYNDSLLIAGTSKGLLIINIKKGSYSFYSDYSNTKDDNEIKSLCKSKLFNDQVWVGTRSGIFQFDIVERKFREVALDDIKISLKQPLNCQSIFEDKYGTIWLGSYWQGLIKLSRTKVEFNSLSACLNFLNIPFKVPIWSVYKSIDGTVWMGADNKLYRVNTKKQTAKVYSFSKLSQDKISDYPVRAIIEDSKSKDKILWIGTLGGGVYKFNTENSDLKKYSLILPSTAGVENNFIYTMAEDKNNNLWIGTNGGGLYKFNKSTEKFQNISFQKDKKPGYQWITSIYKSNSGCLWLGTYLNGLVKFNTNDNSFMFCPLNKSYQNNINNNSILSLYEDSENNLWIGTRGDGLNKFNQKEGKFYHFSTCNGLPDNVIYSIVGDDPLYLWLSTNKGLSKFNLRTNTFTNYFCEDSLQGNEFNLGASYKANDREMFFGGNNGLNNFYPDTNINLIAPDTWILSIRANGLNKIAGQPIRDINTIELPYNENNISISFTSIHFKNPIKNQFKYKLAGYDKDWKYSSNKKEAEYFNLSPGIYAFMVNSANCDGIWGKEPRQFKIIIRMAIWKTWWFYAFPFTMFILLVYAFLKYKIISIAKLEKVKNTEREKIRNKIAADFHDELGHTATLISFLSDILKKEINSNSPNIDIYLDKISLNSKKLFNQMKEFNWELDAEKDSLYFLAENLKNFSDGLFDDNNIAFELKGDLEDYKDIKLPLEWNQQILRIFKEGMHNILKHAKGCNNVLLEVSIINKMLEMTLIDNGQGFIRKDNSVGCGLKNMTERADKINGKLIISSETGIGTKIIFKIKLP